MKPSSLCTPRCLRLQLPLIVPLRTAPQLRGLHALTPTAVNQYHAPSKSIGSPVSLRRRQGARGWRAGDITKRFAATGAMPSQAAEAVAPQTSTGPAADGKGSKGTCIDEVTQGLETVEQSYRRLITSPHVLPEESVIAFLKQCEKLVATAMSPEFVSAAGALEHADKKLGRLASQQQQRQQQHSHAREATTSSLLDLEERSTGRRDQPQQHPEPLLAIDTRPVMQVKVINRISPMLNSLLRDSKVFISEPVLRLYTNLQCDMGQAEHFPEVFRLFATKPIPLQQGTGSKRAKTRRQSADSSATTALPTASTPTTTTITTDIQYTPNSPTSPKSAIPPDLATRALSTAIAQRNLSLALAIIDTTFCTTAHKRAKILRHAGLPLLLALSAPPGAYAAGSLAARYSVAMDPSTATWVGFSAVLAYLTFTGAIGWVAVATANDQMERVVWVPGTPLRERWVREEERRALDRVACAWGFKDVGRRGEEEGEEWEALREIIGLRGMVLDKTELMDGME